MLLVYNYSITKTFLNKNKKNTSIFPRANKKRLKENGKKENIPYCGKP